MSDSYIFKQSTLKKFRTEIYKLLHYMTLFLQCDHLPSDHLASDQLPNGQFLNGQLLNGQLLNGQLLNGQLQSDPHHISEVDGGMRVSVFTIALELIF